MTEPPSSASQPPAAQLARAGANGSSVDDRILAALRAGDELAFHELFRRKYAIMKRVARGYAHCDAIAEEIVQETWLAVINGIDRFQQRSSFDSWMFAILVNQARRHGARERRAVPFSSMDPPDGGEPSVDAARFQTDDETWPGHWATPPRPWQKPDRRLLSLEARDRLRHALAELPERQRVVVALRDVDGCSADEVCRWLGVSEENQRVLLHRGRSRLRAVLDGYMSDEAA